MTEQQTPPEMPPVKIAFVIDNEVVDVLHTDDRLAAIFLSEPLILDVTDIFQNQLVGQLYDPETKTFSPKPSL
jgi:hypothetical protein